MKKKDAFSTLHPCIEFVYFLFVLLVTVFMMHPVILGISMISAFVYATYLNGKKAVKLQLFAVLPLMLITSAINVLFNHQGTTIIAYIDGSPITVETILYGIAASAMFGSVILWFSCYNSVITSDKFIYLFGRIIPALSLLLSMALRFVPRFTHQINETANAQRSIGNNINSGSIFKRAICGLKILSITVTWALESAVVTADSMKNRGYGLRGRTAYSIYRFDKRDIFILCAVFAFGALFLGAAVFGGLYIRYYPSIKTNAVSFSSIVGIIAYALFCNMPMILNISEDIKWKSLESKI